mmetsp:Transcript_5687/g.16918  ORF Transcript_5687/g.16918 Transcript_5687/m.16918 type:complete len:234 (-) Transcript_5687:1505-2206(-)
MLVSRAEPLVACHNSVANTGLIQPQRCFLTGLGCLHFDGLIPQLQNGSDVGVLEPLYAGNEALRIGQGGISVQMCGDQSRKLQVHPNIVCEWLQLNDNSFRPGEQQISQVLRRRRYNNIGIVDHSKLVQRLEFAEVHCLGRDSGPIIVLQRQFELLDEFCKILVCNFAILQNEDVWLALRTFSILESHVPRKLVLDKEGVASVEQGARCSYTPRSNNASKLGDRALSRRKEVF